MWPAGRRLNTPGLTLRKKYISLCCIHDHSRRNIRSNGFCDPYPCRLSMVSEYPANIIGELFPSLYCSRNGHPVVTYRACCTDEIQHKRVFFRFVMPLHCCWLRMNVSVPNLRDQSQKRWHFLSVYRTNNFFLSVISVSLTIDKNGKA